ncbi:MAG TPA: ABC transporter permease [Micromonosporaceae bacterium]|nr:ABC transporter permease [Micromonosporaceae bacterium]
MRATQLPVGPLLGAVLLALAGYAGLTAVLGGLGVGRQIVTASLRAVGQLAAVSAVIVGVLGSAWLTAGFILLMYTVASVTATGRMKAEPRGWWGAPAAIAAGVAPVLAALLLSGLVPLRTVSVLPIAGILIGGAMTATTLCGRRTLEELRTRYGEYEAGLALGMPPREAALEVARTAAPLALVPAIDQTRTVGLVTLPGAFIGVLLGGSSPAQAGAIQVLVLIALLAVESVAALVMLQLVAAGRIAGTKPQN